MAANLSRPQYVTLMVNISDVFAVAKSTFGSDVTIGNYNAAIINEFDFEPVVDINLVSVDTWKEQYPCTER